VLTFQFNRRRFCIFSICILHWAIASKWWNDKHQKSSCKSPKNFWL